MFHLIGNLLILLVIGLISLIVHELGHATAARFFGAQPIQLIIGTGKGLFTFSVGSIEICVHRWFFMHFVTLSSRDSTFTSREIIVTSFMGPMFSILLAIVFYILFDIYFSIYLLYIGYLFNIWLAVFNLIPIKIGQKATDGYMIYKTLISAK